MQSDPRYFSGKDPPMRARCVGYADDVPDNTALGGLATYGTLGAPPLHNSLAGRNRDFPNQLDGVEFQPSETCPKNFIIFDQTENKSRIMYHPMLAHNFGSPGFDIRETRIQNGFQGFSNRYNDNQDNFSSSMREDTVDIDALLSSEEEEEDNDDEEEEDDDVVSTGHTPCGGTRSSSACSCSTEKSKHRDASAEKSFSSTASSSEKKRRRMRKMVKALRDIIPGGEQMDTPAVIDEAVRYLKSLKVEVKNLGIENIED